MSENQDIDILLEGTYLLASKCYNAGDWTNAFRWFSTIVDFRTEGYKDTTSLLQEVMKKLKEQEYEDGRRALHQKEWGTALSHFENIIRLGGDNYLDTPLLMERSKKGPELPNMYASADKRVQQAMRGHRIEDWDTAIRKLEQITEIDEDSRYAKSQLIFARRRRQLANKYEDAMRQCELARSRKNSSEDWRYAVTLVKEVKRGDANYRDVNEQLRTAKSRLKLIINYNKGSKYLDQQKWMRARWYLYKAKQIDPNFQEVAKKLALVDDRLIEQWKKGSFGLEWGRLVGVVMGGVGIGSCIITMLVALFPAFFASIGITMSWGLSNLIFQTEIPVERSIDRVEVLMNGNKLDKNALQKVSSGQVIELEIVAFDNLETKYSSEEIECIWSVAPIGDKDTRIDTDLCKTLYIPSDEFSNQTVVIELNKVNYQSVRGDSISLKFAISR